MRIKLSNLHHNIPLSSKLVNYKTEDICDVLLFDDNFDIYI